MTLAPFTPEAVEAHPSFQHLLRIARYHCGTDEEQEAERKQFELETEDGLYDLEDLVADALADYRPEFVFEDDRFGPTECEFTLDRGLVLRVAMVGQGRRAFARVTQTTRSDPGVQPRRTIAETLDFHGEDHPWIRLVELLAEEIHAEGWADDAQD